MSYPTVNGVIAHLRSSGQPTMAEVVERLADDERRLRTQMAENLRQYYELKDRHEPRPKAESFVNWTGD